MKSRLSPCFLGAWRPATGVQLIDVQPAYLVVVGCAQVSEPAQLLVQIPAHPRQRRAPGPQRPVPSQPAVVGNRRVGVLGKEMNSQPAPQLEQIEGKALEN